MTSNHTAKLQQHYPWTKTPLLANAPMRLIARGDLAAAVTQAGGLGFLASGTDTTTLESDLSEAAKILGHEHSETPDGPVIPIGVGFINWSADLELAAAAIARWRPAAAWLFAPADKSDLVAWAVRIREVSPKTKIWVQVGTVSDALLMTRTLKPDVLVLQGSDAGGHLLSSCASIITLVPEAKDALEELVSQSSGALQMPHLFAAGGIADGRGVVAALALGADGAVMGTRYLASTEANIAAGYQHAVLNASDGGVSTVTSRVYDRLRGTDGWPAAYGARGVINASYEDALAGMPEEENKRQYAEALKQGDNGWGPKGRLTAYAGSGVGLLRTAMPTADINAEVINASRQVLKNIKVLLE